MAGTERLARVQVLLERRAIEDLELIMAYRHVPASRSEVVREAVDWLLAKEAGWLLRARSQEARYRREEDERRERLQRGPAERERLARQALVGEALAIVRRGD